MSSNTFIDALYSKYCDNESVDIIELPQIDGHKRICEYVGFEKIINHMKNVFNLRWIDLSDNGIVKLCDSNFDTEQFILKKTYSLNLAKNLLKNWTDVSEILKLTPLLEELIVSFNPLIPPTKDEIKEINGQFSKLKTIILGNVHYTWNDFLICQYLWPNVEKLSLFENKIINLDVPDGCFQNLRFLSLSKNPISDWKEICKLGKLKNLETLEMPNCKIDQIRFNSTVINLFLSVTYIDLSYNQLNDWRSVAELSKLPKLKTLLLKRNPLFDTNPYYHNFNFILSKIKNLEKLDREPVTKEIRNDGEKYYLRMIYSEYLEKNDPIERNEFLDENPYFLELLNKLGEPVVVKKLSKEEKIRQTFLNINIYDEQNSDLNKRHIQKQIPITLKVSNLKFILRRLFKIDINENISLKIKSSDYEEEMEDRDDVRMYRFDPDTVIHIQRK